jgi:hypothetical protein
VSGPPYAVELHESTPERTSAPLPEIVTGARNHPPAFGARAGTAVVAGVCVSYLTMKLPLELLPALSVQPPFRVVPAVSGPL